MWKKPLVEIFDLGSAFKFRSGQVACDRISCCLDLIRR